MRTISQQIGTALQERKEWAGVWWYRPGEIGGREVKMLDYACGTGSITKALGPWVTKIIGVDISENMVQKYNEEAQAAGLKPEDVRAVQGDLLAEEVPDHLKTAEFYNFDLAVVGLGFHHFENPFVAIERLTERLKPDTGTLMIVDFLPFEKGEHGNAQHTINSGGFTKSNLQALHEAAKMQKFSFSVIDEPAVMELQEGTQKRTLFITRAKRSPTPWGRFANWVHGIQMQAAEQSRFQTTQSKPVPDQLGIVGQTQANTKQKQDIWHKKMSKLGY